MGNLKDIEIGDLELEAMEVNDETLYTDGAGTADYTTAMASIIGNLTYLTQVNPPTTGTELGCC